MQEVKRSGNEEPPGGHMKSSRVKILAVTLAFTLMAAIAVSQTVKRAHMHGDGMFSEHMLGFLPDYLNLTDAQQAQMKDILAKEKPTLQPLMQQMAQSHHDLRQLEESGAFDEAKVRALASQQAQTMTELIVQKARVHSEMLQVLTPDQKTKMSQLMDRHEYRFMKHLQEPAPAPNQ
jgi:Spy/CpxP family protein refolding chaperone